MKYVYRIDLNERGCFRAAVEHERGHDVLTILAGDELAEDETSIFQDGWMRHTQDENGLREYLKHLGIMEDGDTLTMQQ